MLPITEKYLDNYNRPYTKLVNLKAVIIHYTANISRGANAVANRNYFNTKPYIYTTDKKGNRVIVYASAHYIVDDHSIIQCIPDDEVGYHVGAKSYRDLIYDQLDVPVGRSPNHFTIGIEMCVNSDGDFSKTRQNTIELTNYLLMKHNLSTQNVYRHFDITGKSCPKMMVEDAVWNHFLSDVNDITSKGGDIKVNTSELNVRTGPGTNFPISRKLFKGDLVMKTGQEGKWFQIGPDEWIHSAYVIVL